MLLDQLMTGICKGEINQDGFFYTKSDAWEVGEDCLFVEGRTGQDNFHALGGFGLGQRHRIKVLLRDCLFCLEIVLGNGKLS